MCCGLAPGGSVCLGRMAAALIPCSQGGPKLEVSALLRASFERHKVLTFAGAPPALNGR